MKIELGEYQIREWRLSDAASIAKYANNKKIWINLRDIFPHPYSLKDAEEFLQRHVGEKKPKNFAIANSEEAIGGIGIHTFEDVNRLTAELGYWLAEPFWNQGIMSEVVSALVPHIFKQFEYNRLQACIFEWNYASGHILKKAGFHLESRMEKSAIKDGKVIDQLVYVRLRDHSVS